MMSTLVTLATPDIEALPMTLSAFIVAVIIPSLLVSFITKEIKGNMN
jgi:hypothetical protein